MAPKRKSRSRPAPYDPELPINWTLQRLREELLRKGIRAPQGTRRMALVRMLNENQQSASTSNFETTPRSEPIRTTGNGPVNNGDRTVVDIVSRLTSTVHTLQQSVSTLNEKVNNLSTQVNDAVNRVVVTQSDRTTLVRGNSTEQPQHTGTNVNEQSQVQGFTMATAIAALNSNQIRTVSAAAGSEAQASNTNNYKRTAFGYSAESLPLVETVAPNIRQSIIQGKDVNLASLLIPSYSGPCSDVYEENTNISLCHQVKPDHRLNRSLNIGEFIQAFGIYKSIMCSTFPSRRMELDLYERDIVDMASKYPGKGFYEYHKQFSLIAASQLKYNNILVDWSVRNNTLFCNILANVRPHTCETCDSTLHTTGFCPNSQAISMEDRKEYNKRKLGNNETDSHGRKRIYFKGREICNNFNGDRGCSSSRCNNWHICSDCKGEHSKSVCPLSKNDQAPQYKGALSLRK